MAGGLSLGCTPVLPGSTRVSPRRHKGCPAGSRAVLGTQPGPPGSRGVGRGEQAPVSLPRVRGTERARARSGTKRGSPSSHAPHAALPPPASPVSLLGDAGVGCQAGAVTGAVTRPRPGPAGPRDRAQQHTGGARDPARHALEDGDSDGSAHGGDAGGGARRSRGVAPLLCPSALTLCKGGSGKRTPRNARATGPEPGPLRGHAHVRSTSVAEGRVSAPQPPGTETVCSPSLLRNRLSRASQWCDLNIQLVFTEHTTVNQRKLNVYLKPPLKALLIIF